MNLTKIFTDNFRVATNQTAGSGLTNIMRAFRVHALACFLSTVRQTKVWTLNIYETGFGSKRHSTFTRTVFASAVLLSLAAHVANSSASAQTVAPRSEATTSQSKRDSTVRGRVVYEDTNRPLRRVSVNIFDPNNRASYRTGWTDGRGEFVFKNMPAGTYYLMVRAPGIILLRAGLAGRGEGSDYAPTATVDGANSASVRVSVRRGAAVAGLVKYADGDPAINAQIIVLRRDGEKLVPVQIQREYGDGHMLTDERGWFRISGLAPGEYLIAAAEQKMNAEPLREDEGEGGTRYKVVLLILGANERRANIITAWIVRPNTDFPSLVTLYVE